MDPDKRVVVTHTAMNVGFRLWPHFAPGIIIALLEVAIRSGRITKYLNAPSFLVRSEDFPGIGLIVAENLDRITIITLKTQAEIKGSEFLDDGWNPNDPTASQRPA